MSITLAVHYVAAAMALPNSYKADIQSKVELASAALREANGGEIVMNYGPFIIALGILVALGGVFLSLAAHHVLPQGLNAISSLGTNGQALGYSVIGLGTLIVIIGATKFYLIRKQNSIAARYPGGVGGVRNRAELDAMNDYFPKILKTGDVMIVDHYRQESIIIYHRLSENVEGRHEMISYTSSTVKKVFEEWFQRHRNKAQYYIYGTILNERIKEFEKTSV